MNDLFRIYFRLTSQQNLLLASIIIVIILAINFFLFYAPVIMADAQRVAKYSKNTFFTGIVEAKTTNEIVSRINEEQKHDYFAVKSASHHTITAYNSEAAQTDASPCITANGFNVCEHGVEDTIAANFLKFGTKVRIPELFGDRVFIVRDRMNKRYNNRVDVWMLNKADARQFGVQYAKIEVLK